MSARDALRGARVEHVEHVAGQRALRIDLALRAADDGSAARHVTLLCSVEQGARGIGLVSARKRSRAPSAASVQLGRSIEGARLLELERTGTSLLWLVLEHAQRRLHLAASFRGRGALQLTDEQGTVLWSSSREPVPPLEREGAEAFDPAESLDELTTDGRALWAQLQALALQRHRELALRAVRGAHAKRERRLVAIEGDRERARQATALRADASLLLSNLHALRRDATELSAVDYASDPPATRVLHIDASLGPAAQAEAWFARARKLERGARMAMERSRTTREELDALAALIERIEQAPSHAEIDAVFAEARAFGVSPEASREQAKGAPATRAPYREFRGHAGRAIYVGKSAKDNDALTLRHAKPHDLWLHVRDGAGSHVVVPLRRDEACPPELLCDAATLAAHFSSARSEPRADVIYTLRRYVQKPRKSATGSVLLLREKVFRLELEPARLARLLAAEWAPGS